jgi:hypothetical protein
LNTNSSIPYFPDLSSLQSQLTALLPKCSASDRLEINAIISQSIAEEQHLKGTKKDVRMALSTTRAESSKMIHGPPTYSTFQQLESDIAVAYGTGTLPYLRAVKDARKWFPAYTAALSRTWPIV